MARKKNSPYTAAAKILGAQGGKRGGPARAAALSHAQKSAIARKGGLASVRSGKGTAARATQKARKR